MFLFLLVLPVAVLCLIYIKCVYLPFQVLKRNGIDGPRPSFFYGNYKERVGMGTLKYLPYLRKKYGTLAGHYIGVQPFVLVSDVELLKQILVKDFHLFTDRGPLPTIPPGLLTTGGDTWRSMRRILSPTFSSFKMKAMTPIIMKSVTALVDVLRGHADTDKSFEVFEVYGAFTMESTLASFLGREIEIQLGGQTDPLTSAAVVFLAGNHERKVFSALYWIMMFSNFPWLVPVVTFVEKWTAKGKAKRFLCRTAEAIIHQRGKEEDTAKYKDLLQLMIDATAEEEGDKGTGKRRLTNDEIIGNVMSSMMAGYETTAKALSFTSYLLALNPHIQEKLQQEIDRHLEENPDESQYQVAQDIEYLDMVLQESLRLYPPAPVFNRLCLEDYRYNGVTIPKGSLTIFASPILHKDPQFWPDPETFDPSRFTAEEKAKRPPFCFLPFGHGPRSCIGMRFALLEAKLALVELLSKFSFVRAPDTQVPLEVVMGFTQTPKNGLYLKVVTRDV